MRGSQRTDSCDRQGPEAVDTAKTTADKIPRERQLARQTPHQIVVRSGRWPMARAGRPGERAHPRSPERTLRMARALSPAGLAGPQRAASPPDTPARRATTGRRTTCIRNPPDRDPPCQAHTSPRAQTIRPATELGRVRMSASSWRRCCGKRRRPARASSRGHPNASHVARNGFWTVRCGLGMRAKSVDEPGPPCCCFGMTEHDCRACGACCTSPFEDDESWATVDDDEVSRLPPRFRLQVIDSHLKTRRKRSGHVACSALAGTVGVKVRCQAYASRPRVCEAFKPGSSVCVEARHRAGVQLAR